MRAWGNLRQQRREGAILLRSLIVGLALIAAWLWWAGGKTSDTPDTGPTGSATVASLDLVPVIRIENQLVPLSNTSSRPLAPAPSAPTNPPPATNTVKVPPSGNYRALEAQLALARLGFSPGSLDGLIGSQTRAALSAYYSSRGRVVPAESNALFELSSALVGPVFTNHIIASNDLTRLLPVEKTWLAKSQQPRLDYETILELVAERFWSHPNLVRRLNPAIDWTNISAGAVVRVPCVEPPMHRDKAAFLRIYISNRSLQAFDEYTNILVHFPCSIAQRVEKRPVGERLEVIAVASNPNYTFDPDVFPESAEAREIGRKLILPPGPNNPVGTIWIGLDKPGYGIHGTPRPEDVGRTESHGCFRLANWNAELLFKLVWIGLPVFVEP